ncbi:hypothetical protein Avbf_05094 [Armadillidium vulgare]|nr:hypothetical protein Avbf_05094 [Armadillidium vulgare]
MGKMEKVSFMEPYEALGDSSSVITSSELEEGRSPSKALYFKKGSVSLISGSSSSLEKRGFKPFDDTHFNTQFALAVTEALATFHGILCSKGIRNLKNAGENSHNNERRNKLSTIQCDDLNSESSVSDYIDCKSFASIDPWTSQISNHSLIVANLSIMVSQFRTENISPRIIHKLECLKNDVHMFSKFIQFASAMQMEKCLQSIGPISMCDIWVPKTSTVEGQLETLIIRLRGGPDLQAPPMRDITWIWLTLLRPEILHDRYTELCESYYTSFNNTVKRHNSSQSIEELTLFDVMRDLGDSFLHAFLTIVHKFTLSGVWCLDRQLHTSEGIRSISESLGIPY